MPLYFLYFVRLVLFYQKSIKITVNLRWYFMKIMCRYFTRYSTHNEFELFEADKFLEFRINHRNIFWQQSIISHIFWNFINLQFIFLQLPLILKLILSFFLNFLIDDLTDNILFFHFHNYRVQFFIHHTNLPASFQIRSHQFIPVANKPLLVHFSLHKVENAVLNALVNLEWE